MVTLIVRREPSRKLDTGFVCHGLSHCERGFHAANCYRNKRINVLRNHTTSVGCLL